MNDYDATTGWFPALMRPERDGWYEFESGDRLHWDSRSWGKWFAEKPGVRFTVPVEAGWRWRGRAQP